MKNLSRRNKILIIVISIFLIIIGAALEIYLFAKDTYNKKILVTDPKKDFVIEPENDENNIYTPEPSVEPVEEEKYGIESDIVNILLVGVDTRAVFEDSRTDSIIIATVDPTSKKVKLTSFMRDMYVEIPGKGYQKINAAFQIGGINLLKKTIKYNFGLNVNNHVAIDFKGFQELIDMMNGVEVDVKSYELNEINKYIGEVNGAYSTILDEPGLQTLNGQQALSYCRIRMVGNNDYERTERQRRVLSLLLAKIKDTKVINYPKLYSIISPYLKTNIQFNYMLKQVYTVYKLVDSSPSSLRIPIDNHFKDTFVGPTSVLIPDLKYNATELYKFIYNVVPRKLVVPDNSKVYSENRNIESGGNSEQTYSPVISPQTCY